mgnify:CR=1 FL=1
MFSKKIKNLEVENDRLKRSNEDLTRRVEDLQNTINELTLLYSNFPQLEKAMSFECRTCKYAYKSDNYFNYGEAIGCMRKCVCGFYERIEENEENDEDDY